MQARPFFRISKKNDYGPNFMFSYMKLMARTVRVKFRGCAGYETFDVKTERVLTVAS